MVFQRTPRLPDQELQKRINEKMESWRQIEKLAQQFKEESLLEEIKERKEKSNVDGRGFLSGCSVAVY